MLTKIINLLFGPVDHTHSPGSNDKNSLESRSRLPSNSDERSKHKSHGAFLNHPVSGLVLDMLDEICK